MKSGSYVFTVDELSVIYPYNCGSRYGSYYSDLGEDATTDDEERKDSTWSLTVDRIEGDLRAVSVEEYWG